MSSFTATLFRLGLVVAVLFTSVQAQETFRFGIKGGLGVTSFRGHDIPDTDSKTGFVGGVFARVPVSEYLSVQPELLYVSRGAEKHVLANGGLSSLSWDYRFDYIELPVLLCVQSALGDNFLISGLVGPSLAFRTGSDFSIFENTVETVYDIGNVRSVVVDMVIGMGVDLAIGRHAVGLEVRYTPGLQEFLKDDDVLFDGDKTVNFIDEATGKALNLRHTSISFLATVTI